MASAAPTEVTVRIEGSTRTLFEGPIVADGHAVRAASDTRARRCDGTNAKASPISVPTPTAAGADAMSILGDDFDARWYPGYDDYFVQRWGSDREAAGAYWGVLVNGTFTSVGGCQRRLFEGDGVLWAYDAFRSRPFLRLAAADDPSTFPASPLPISEVQFGETLEVEALSYTGGMDGGPSGLQPAAGVSVAPVEADPQTGYERVLESDPQAVLTGVGGTATVSFPDSGWHRIKAASGNSYVRSNRLDVCVIPAGEADCGPLPDDAQVRTPPPPPQLEPEPEEEPGAGRSQGSAPSGGGNAGWGPSSDWLTLGRVTRNKSRGTAVIAVAISGSGRVSLSGGKVATQSKRVTGKRRLRLRIEARGAALAKLRSKGKAKVSLTVGFAPDSGFSEQVSRRVVLRCRCAGRS